MRLATLGFLTAALALSLNSGNISLFLAATCGAGSVLALTPASETFWAPERSKAWWTAFHTWTQHIGRARVERRV